MQWEPGHIDNCQPSIEYLELYAVTVGIFLLSQYLSNRRGVIFCDNESVVHMLNSSSSSEKNCMYLITAITLCSLKFNTRYFACHIIGQCNIQADNLSHLCITKFRELAPVRTNAHPTKLPDELYPASKIWVK